MSPVDRPELAIRGMCFAAVPCLVLWALIIVAVIKLSY